MRPPGSRTEKWSVERLKVYLQSHGRCCVCPKPFQRPPTPPKFPPRGGLSHGVKQLSIRDVADDGLNFDPFYHVVDSERLVAPPVWWAWAGEYVLLLSVWFSLNESSLLHFGDHSFLIIPFGNNNIVLIKVIAEIRERSHFVETDFVPAGTLVNSLQGTSVSVLFVCSIYSRVFYTITSASRAFIQKQDVVITQSPLTRHRIYTLTLSTRSFFVINVFSFEQS